jgi:hypothetical protein
MAMEEYFRINSPKIVHEIVDGEAVIINLDLGHYYSADNVGAFIWEKIGNIASESEVVESVVRHYAGDKEQIEDAVRQFFTELKQDDLIITTTAQREVTSGSRSGGEDQESSCKPAFVPPVLVKYTDMEYLLLLDPIHEVDESGWPHPLTDKK